MIELRNRLVLAAAVALLGVAPLACAIRGPGAGLGEEHGQGAGGSDATTTEPEEPQVPQNTDPPPDDGGDGGGKGEPKCPHEGPPVLDPGGLPACPSCGGGHCLPKALVPADQLDQLGDCDADSKCVPDLFLETGGDFIPETCASIGGLEGRCLSTCLPDVAAQASELPQSTCGASEVCVPCYDPLDLAPSGACSLSCDPGPASPPQGLPKCCGGIGTCVPQASVPPDQAKSLQADSCPQNGGALVCAPDVFVSDPNYQPDTCETSLISALFGSEYAEGRCLPKCLKGVDNFLVQKDGCQGGFVCAPCLEPPFGTPSGACDL